MTPMNETMNEAELKDATHVRDAASVGSYEVRFTAPEPWIDALNADAKLDAIEDKIVWLSIVSGRATLEQIIGAWRPGGDRVSPLYDSRYIRAAYLARGQLCTGAFYCGVVWVCPDAPSDAARARSEACALKLQEVARQVQSVLSRIDGIEVRGGGALWVHQLDEAWLPAFDASIAPVPALSCAVCKDPIHFANSQWRHTSNHQAEAYDEQACPRCHGSRVIRAAGRERSCPCLTGKVKRLNHVATPADAREEVTAR